MLRSVNGTKEKYMLRYMVRIASRFENTRPLRRRVVARSAPGRAMRPPASALPAGLAVLDAKPNRGVGAILGPPLNSCFH